MKTSLLKCVAIALGLSVGMTVGSAVQAQNAAQPDGYQPPSKWSRFNSVKSTAKNVLQTISTAANQETASGDEGQDAELAEPTDSFSELPSPQRNSPPTEQPTSPPEAELLPPAMPVPDPQASGTPNDESQATASPSDQMPHPEAVPMPGQEMVFPTTHDGRPFQPLQSQNGVPMQQLGPPPMGPTPAMGPPYQPAPHFAGPAYNPASNCGTPTRPPLNPWFGGFNVLMLDVEDHSDRSILAWTADGAKALNLSEVDSDSGAAFEIFGGRYLDDARFGLSVSYLFFDPSSEESRIAPPTAGDYHVAIDAWDAISIDPTGGATYDTVYNHMALADAYRLRRDMRFQGVEVNLASFGLMGAQRAAGLCSEGSAGTGLGAALGLNSGCYGYGSSTGPLVRSTTGRVRVQTSHGFRWFQLEDELELAANVDGLAGFAAQDLYSNLDIDNNLYGYQFGSRLTYCIGNRFHLGLGGKFGIYSNDVEMRHRIGTTTVDAHVTGSTAELINTESSDTSIATMGELDLGLGARLNNAWTLRGGYRLMGMTGVATTAGSLDHAYDSVESSRQIDANDSLILHGGYVGLDFNW
ncbi:BBP7 family outer membrane beta-barrel protein [Novipirellula artificiosorum]|uniref:Outer membrane protein beta-barrel domain-containing protein n=1 Tax=Novipirellula artificiosorum TaxID=2528016 RepID=A0A5C6DJA5_9BACT|nr:BBP7 family outer membrane beta-barrel protein [Novipirellula artificiosorum]TWU34996.1 hypothetical protein Poly41_41400 [Novipirellula artificiosorum]